MTSRRQFLALGAAALARAQDLYDTGPSSLVLVYHCLPARRSQMLQSMRGAGLKLFEDWKTRGAVMDYQLLVSRYVHSDAWDMLALVHFRRYEDVARWRAVEQHNPAGLPPEALEGMTAVETYPADLVRRQAPASAVQHPVYVVTPFTFSMAVTDYLGYVDNSVRQMLEGATREGILNSYQLYLQRYPAGRSWNSLLVVQYKDDASLGLREKVAAKLRQELQLSADRQTVGTPKESVIADDLAQ
jgi:hypothetical protein